MKRITKHFNPATVMALAAMIFAMAGGAYAATGGGHAAASKGHHANAKNKKGKGTTKGKRGPRGPQGPEGKQGPAGPAGPAGPQGVAGANGKDGAAGAAGGPGESVTVTNEGECTKFSNASGEGKACAGKAGENGKSVEVVPGEPASCNGQGGVNYEIEESGTATAICNGANGANGAMQPGETLAKGVTETGAWAFSGSEGETAGGYAAISFTIPLSAVLKSESVHYVPFGTVGGESCDKGTSAFPKAAEGQLCVYGSNTPVGATFAGIFQLGGFQEGANRPGAVLKFTSVANGAWATGSWAVTG